MSSGSVSILSRSSRRGIVNGWCSAAYFFSSSSYLNMGKLTTHRSAWPERAMPSSVRHVQAQGGQHGADTWRKSSAANKRRSPGSAPAACLMASWTSSPRNLTIGLFSLPSLV